MKLEIFTLCDAATDERGKLNIVGAFDRIISASVPAVHSSCSLVARVLLEGEEKHLEHTISINFLDPSKKVFIKTNSGRFRVKPEEDEQATARANIIMDIQGMKLDEYGDYEIQLSIDDELHATTPFYVVNTPKGLEK